MAEGPYLSFATRLINLLKKQGHIASRSPKGICIKTLAQFTGASEQMCRRYIRGEGLPDFEKIKKLAANLKVNPGWLLFGDEGHPAPNKNAIDETMLHYILKQSHHLYRNSRGDNTDYADFVLGLIREVNAIDTSHSNLIKIIDLAISSISTYEMRSKHSHTV